MAPQSPAPETTGFREECEMLAPLETFDPEAFRGNNDVPQAVCNFVLTLALIHNDCKDAVYVHVALAGMKPGGQPRRTRVWGAISGAQHHAVRAIAGLMHELFELIGKNEKALRHPFFASVVEDLYPKSRKAWSALVDVARGATPTDPVPSTYSSCRPHAARRRYS